MIWDYITDTKTLVAAARLLWMGLFVTSTCGLLLSGFALRFLFCGR